MIEYWQQNTTTMLLEVQQHILMVGLSLVLALLLAIILIALFLRHQQWLNGLIYFFSLLYSIPSFAFFVLLLPLFGLGIRTAVVVLTIYCEYILLRSFITGIRTIDPQLVEVARGIGMTDFQVFWHIQFPLALPAIFSGIQVALASTMAIATIAATINAGGLGELLFTGLQAQQIVPILWGIFLTIALTLLCAGIINLIKWLLIHSWKDTIKESN